MSDTEHLDTNTVPPWLMDAAKPDVNAIGWLVSGYLAGVEVARKSGPCGQQLLVSAQNGPLTVVACGLAHGHRGDHRREWTFMWVNDSALPATPTPPVERGGAQPG